MEVHLGHRGLTGAALIAAAALCLCLPIGASNAATTVKKPPVDGAKTPPVSATVTTPAERCEDLEKLFDTSLPKHMDAKNLTSAKKWRAEGEKRCDGGKHAVGAWWLARALTELGVDPGDQK